MKEWLKNNDLHTLEQFLKQLLIQYGPRFLTALLLLVVGWFLIGFVQKILRKFLIKSSLDDSLRIFLGRLFNISLKVLLIISVASQLGIETTSFIAVLGAAGLAIGLALQGSLANFAGGVLILVFKPFRVGDLINTGSHLGFVKSIDIIYTTIDTPTGERVTIPNGNLANNPVINITSTPERRVDLTFGIHYGDSIELAKAIIREVISKEMLILKEPEPVIAVIALADSSVNIVCRFWCKNEDYLFLLSEIMERVKLAFDQQGIRIPFPQRDVYLHPVQSPKQANP